MDKSSIIKMVKAVSTKIEMAKAIIQIALCFNAIKLSKTQITVLSYFMVYGINQQTKNLIVKAGICKNINNIKTIMVRLKKLELIFKDDFSGKVLISKALTLDLTSTIVIYLKIDNKV